MTDVLLPNQPQILTSDEAIGKVADKRAPPPSPLSALPLPTGVRSGHLNLDTFSPVNQNGSFAFDQVLKSGQVHKRTRKTKQWKPFHLVLRPGLLSLYKTATEERLLKQISLSELTAAAFLKDPKGRRQHLFGLFSPSRNYHLQAQSDTEAHAWVELIKREARVDEEEQELYLNSPTGISASAGIASAKPGPDRWDHERLGSSSPDPVEGLSIRQPALLRDGVQIPSIRRPSVPSLDYSGDEFGPSSDFSDTPPHSYTTPSSFKSIINRKPRRVSRHQTLYSAQLAEQQPPRTTARNASQTSGFHVDHDDERVVWHGYLVCLKNKGGVRQWKRLWVVLRPKNLAFYKNDEEYAANLILPLANIINAVEIDPVSKSKTHCMQVIAEEKSYRLCAESEDALAEWLGALKSQLARRKEKEKEAARLKGVNA